MKLENDLINYPDPEVTPSNDRIRSNALQHGLTARLVLWKNENPEHFQDLLMALVDQFRPANDVEFLCVEEMAMAKWRMRRAASIETAAGNKQLALTTERGAAATLKAFTDAQQSGQLLTALRQLESSHASAYQRAFHHLRQLREC